MSWSGKNNVNKNSFLLFLMYFFNNNLVFSLKLWI